VTLNACGGGLTSRLQENRIDTSNCSIGVSRLGAATNAAALPALAR
jgi:hypothetical protein